MLISDFFSKNPIVAERLNDLTFDLKMKLNEIFWTAESFDLDLEDFFGFIIKFKSGKYRYLQFDFDDEQCDSLRVVEYIPDYADDQTHTREESWDFKTLTGNINICLHEIFFSSIEAEV